MLLRNWIDSLRKPRPRSQRNPNRTKRRFQLEDLETRCLLTFGALNPEGSLIHGDVIEDTFAAANEVDTHTFDLDAGQTLSSLFTPLDASIQGRIELFEPGAASPVISIDAAAADNSIGFNAFSVTVPGTHTLQVTSLAGSGNYVVDTILNAVGEQEDVSGIGSNDTLATSENIDASAIPLQGTADRVAAVGDLNSPTDEDWYSFTVAPGQPTSLIVESAGDSAAVELFDAAGTLLAVGSASSTNADQVISDFIDPTGGTFHARITGADGEFYTMLVTRGADFDSESLAQDISLTGQSLGNIGSGFNETLRQDGNVIFPQVKTFSFNSLFPTGVDVTMTVNAAADLSATSEFLAMDAEGVFSNNFFVTGGTDGGQVTAVFTIPAAQFNQLLADDGVATFTFTPTSGVNFIPGGPNFIEINLATPFDTDTYTFEANEGDTIVIETTTPFGELADSFDLTNPLDPRVELYFGSTLVAQDNNGAADLKNAMLSYTVPVGSGGTYFVGVNGASGKGEYSVRVSGSTVALPATFAVSAATPLDTELVNAYPATISIDFADAVLLTSVTGSDLMLTDPLGATTAAVGFSVVDSDTIDFDTSTLAAGDGAYTLSIAGGAVTSLSGRTVEAFTSTFVLDSTPPVVTSITADVDRNGGQVADFDEFDAGPINIAIDFSEPLDAGVLNNDDVTLIDSVTGAFFAPDSLTYNPSAVSPAPQLSIGYDFVPAGLYELRLLSHGGAFRDPAGNPLNGDGAGGDLVRTIFIDEAGATPIPTPLFPATAGPSLIYSTTVEGTFHGTGDVDSFTIDVDPGQSMTAIFRPVDPGLDGAIEVTGPASSSGTTDANGVDVPELVQTFGSGIGGTVTINVTSVAGAGRYEVDIVLNAHVEEEGLDNLIGTNDTALTAENIDVSAVSLGGGADRLGVLGRTGVGTIVSEVPIGFNDTNINAQPLGMVFDPATSEFLFVGQDGNLYSLSTTGFSSLIGPMDGSPKDLAIVGGTLYGVDRFSDDLRQIDPLTGATLSSQQLTTSLGAVNEAFSIATHPVTGELWALLGVDFVEVFQRVVATIDPATGIATIQAPYAEPFAAITFDDVGTLLGVTGGAGLPPESLYEINPVDGSASFIAALTPGGGGEALAFNPADSSLYRASGFRQRFDRLDISTVGDQTDNYSFTLAAGQTATIVVTSQGAPVELELLDATGTPLALGVQLNTNVDQVIADYVNTSGSPVTLVAQVSATGSPDDYSLVVTRDATFNLDPNNLPSNAQPIGATNQVLTELGGGVDVSGAIVTVPIFQSDGLGYNWDIQGNGSINDGTSDAYDGGFVNSGFNFFSEGSLEADGRELALGPRIDGDVEIVRKVYVSPNDGFARFLEIYTNTGVSTVARTVNINSNLGSDGGESILGTSSGDFVVDSSDRWSVSDDGSFGDPAVGFVVAGIGAPSVSPTTFTRSGDQVNYSFDLSLAPGETQILMSFGVQDFDGAAALARTAGLENPTASALAGMSVSELGQVVNFNLSSARYYSVDVVTAGTDLTVSTSTPGDHPLGQPENSADPRIQILDPAGVPLGSDDNSATDGRNALLTVPAAVAGRYLIVLESAGGAGPLMLNVSAASPGDLAAPSFEVVASSPLPGSTFSSLPQQFEVDLSGAVLISSLDANDLQITTPSGGSFSPGSVTLIDGNTLEFDLAGLAFEEGQYQVSMASGALIGVTGLPIQPFTSDFLLDLAPPKVVSVTANSQPLPPDGVFPAGGVTFQITFSENIQALAGPEDIVLQELTDNTVFEPDVFLLSGSTLTLEFSGLPEGPFELRLLSDGFLDLAGNLLDGNGDTFEGDDFVLNAFSDLDLQLLPVPVATLLPPQLLIYETSTTGFLHSGDVLDTLQLPVEGGQTASFLLQPLNASILAEIDLIDSSGVIAGPVAAGAPGAAVLLQSVGLPTSDTFGLGVSSLAGSGRFQVTAVLNAEFEEEGIISSAGSNDVPGSAQSLGSAAANLPIGDHFGVLGSFADFETDVYSVALTAGQYASIHFTGDPTAVLELLDAAGNALATGSTSVDADGAILDFLPSVSGPHFLRVTGGTAGTATSYHIGIARGGTFEFESNDQALQAQSIHNTGLVIGAVDEGISVSQTLNNPYFPNVLTYQFPRSTPVSGDVVMNLTVKADLSATSEFITFSGEGVLAQTLWQNDGFEDAIQSQSITIARADFNQLIADDGIATFVFTPSSAVNNFGTAHFLTVELEFPPDSDFFRFEANAGDALVIQSTTPGDGFGEPDNALDPTIELFFDAGTGVVSVATGVSTGDGRNESINYSVPSGASGTYFVQVSAVDSGSYTLEVAGYTGLLTTLGTVDSRPFDGEVANFFPTQLEIDFEVPVLLTSLDATDLFITPPGGSPQPVVGLSVIDGDTIGFDPGIVGPADGVYTISMPAGAVTSIDGRLFGGFASTFTLDATSPTVTSVTVNGTTVTGGETVANGPTTVEIQFSEPLNEVALGLEDVQLVSGATPFVASTFFYNPATFLLTLEFDDLPEATFTLTLDSDAAGFRDLQNNPLDGDPGVVGPDDFVVSWETDNQGLPYPSLVPVLPLGSLVFDPPVFVQLEPGDTDEFTVSLDAGQSLTATLSGAFSGFDGLIEVIDSTVYDTASSPAIGEPAVLQVAPVSAAGTYTIRVSSLTGTGQAELRLWLNTLLEVEPLTGVANDTAASAEQLDLPLPKAAFLPLLGNGERAAVQGHLDVSDSDFYGVNLAIGQSLSLSATDISGGGAPLSLSLFDPTGTTLLASGLPVDNVGTAIDGFVAQVAGNYVFRVEGPAGTDYSALVLRNSQFSLEPNDSISDAQPLVFVPDGSGGSTAQVLGGRQVSTLLIEPDGFSAGTDLTDAFPGVTLRVVGADGVTSTGAAVNSVTSSRASTGTRIFSNGGGTTFNSGSSWLRADFANPTAEVSIDVIGDDNIDPGILRAYDAAGNLLAEVIGSSVPAGTPQPLSISRTLPDIAYILAAGQGGETAHLDNLAAQGGQDVFTIELQAGDTLNLLTSTPFGGPLDPPNQFDPQITLIDPNSFIVGVDDNGAPDGNNAQLAFTATTSGVHVVRVDGGNVGAYTLHAQRTSVLTDPPPFVVSAAPPSGSGVGAPPTTLRLTLSEALRLDTIDASDLTLTGPGSPSVDSVTIIDARTLEFGITVPNIEGQFDYTLTSGSVSDLQNSGNVAYSGSFVIDQTGPFVAGSTPSVQASAPFNTFTFTFSEQIDPASVNLSDVAVAGPGGAVSVSSVVVNGADVTLFFPDQNTLGTYTVSIGPDLRDLSGNLMDNDKDGLQGEAIEDVQTVPLQLQSPDLTVNISTSPATAFFGDTINVAYTVTNIGLDPAAESWNDRIWLSVDSLLSTTADNTLLATVTGTSNLSAGNNYSRNESVVLPLNITSANGNFNIIVQTDALNQQPESLEGNNTDVSPISLTLPPLPDLIVSDISVPPSAFSGNDIIVSWTITNQGSGNFSGSFRDQLFLSTDMVFGGDPFYGNFDFTGTIPAGGSITRQQTISLPDTLEGNQWLIVRTDSQNTTFEGGTGEANNVTVDDVALNVTLRPFPNLQVTDVTVPPTAFSSQPVVIQWIVTNTGTGPTSTPSWTDRVWLSLDQTLDSTDTSLGTASNPSFLNPGDSYSNQAQFTLPQGIDGNFFFIVQADNSNRVFEFQAEGDNIRAGGPTDVTLTPPPDLQVTSVNAPTTAFSGQPATISWTVSNQGAGATLESFWRDRIYLSTDNVFDAGDTLLGTQNHVGALASSGSYTASRSVTLPIGISGNFYFFVQTDTFNEVFEHVFEGNNTAFDDPPTQVNLTPPPDLEVDLVDAPATGRAGTPLTITYSVTNFGATQTPNTAWNDRIYLSADNTLEPGTDLLLGTRRHFGALDSGDSYTSSPSFTLPNTLTGNYFVFVETDVDNEVFEIDFPAGNNVGLDPVAMSVQLLPADLVVTGSNAPATGVTGESVTVDWTVQNVGVGDTIVSNWTDRVYLSTDGVFSGDDLLLTSSNHNGLLNPGGQYSASATASLPASLDPGNYRIFIVTDQGNAVFEANNGNNVSAALPIVVTRKTADLQVTSVTVPASALSATDLPISWTVQNFGTTRTSSNSWFDNVYLSTDTTIDGGDLLLGSIRRSNALDGGQQYTASQNFRLPFDLAGDFYALVRTDSTNAVFETPFESNNDGGSSATVAVNVNPNPNPEETPLPADLVVTDVDAPTDALSGQDFSLSWTVRNDGLPTGNRNWIDSIYLSLDQFFDTTDVFIGAYTQTGGLATGASTTRTELLTVPRGLAGQFYVFVRTDSTQRILETDNANNTGFDPVPLAITLPPPTDLVVGSITVPSNGVPGQNATITYTIENQSVSSALGSWFDSIYISADDVWDINDSFFGRVRHVGNVAGGTSYTESLTAALPGVLPGDYHVIIRSDILNHIPESDEANNIGASLDQVSLDAEELLLEVPAEGNLGSGQSVFYRIDVPAGETLIIDLDSQSGFASNELYVSFDEMPSRSRFDFSHSAPFSPDQRVVVPATRGGTYYVLATSNSSPGGPAAYSIEARLLSLEILEVSPQQGSNLGEVTVALAGAQFAPNGVVQLVAPDTSTRDASVVRWKDSGTVWATFDLQGLAPDLYDVQIVQDGQSTLLEDAFTVNTGILGSVQATLSSPGALRPGQSGIVRVDYANVGQTDVVSPILVVSAVDAVLRPEGSDRFVGNTVELLAINDNGPAGILTPGATGSFFLTFAPTINGGRVDFSVEAINPSDVVIDWNAMKDDVKPDHLTQAAWDATFANFVVGMGSTVADYVAALSDNATHLSLLDNYVADVQSLLAFELAQAGNTLLGATPLSHAVDLVTPTPGLSLALTRVFPSTLADRFELGPLGYGWKHLWEISAQTSDLGNVMIHDVRAYRTFILEPDGSYRTLGGEQADLTLTGGRYRLQEADGTVIHFRADGQLDRMEDVNGTSVSAMYTGDLMTSLVHSNGNALTFTYDANDRITRIDESSGRSSVYTYDATGEHLLSVTTNDGTTQYTYDSGNGLQREHSLLSVTYPGGDQELYQYDALGRIVRESANGGIDALNYSYDSAAGITISDDQGGVSSLLINASGQIGQVVDPLNRGMLLRYDDENNLVQRVQPGNFVTNYEYDDRGNLIRQIDPIGNTVVQTYDSVLDRLLTVTSASGDTIRYEYDARGNTTAIFYPDGTSENAVFDGQGNLVSQTNRRNQTINFEYDSDGNLTRRVYPDSTEATFTYDSHGNRLTATDDLGTTTFAYDAADRVTGITYPGGRSLSYTYDAGGRRTSMTDHDGNVVNYTYDSLGRLTGLTDGLGAAMVSYTYDSLSQIVRSDQGNGSFTTYAYDLSGQLTRMTNHAADGSVNSDFQYSYDVLKRAATVTTLEGVTQYTYDPIGQLSSVTLPGGRFIQYTYDDDGNRISVDDNGVVTPYFANETDQYTGIGTATLTYDADGNLVSSVDGGNTTQYTYDFHSRLVGVTAPNGDTWNYQYDALGNRVASIHNGTRTEFLVDLNIEGALANVVGEYDGANNVIARYTHGLELVSRIDGSGAAAYYDFDQIGSVVGLTGGGGSLLNEYRYLPFGELLSSTETVANPFRFGGQAGVMSEANGLNFMRARFYSPEQGRFISSDPDGIVGGLNLYAYVQNDPINYTDPTGLGKGKIIGWIVEQTASGRWFRKKPLYNNKQVREAIDNGVDVSVRDSKHFAGKGQKSELHKSKRGEQQVRHRHPNPRTGSHILQRSIGISAVLTFTHHAEAHAAGNVPIQVAAEVLDFFNPLALPNDILHIIDSIGGLFPHDDGSTSIVAPSDPNDIVGPEGFGEEHFVTATETFPYTVRFENMAEATAPAQEVTVHHPLDSDLDLRTFRFGSFGWGGFLFEIPGGVPFLNERVDLRDEFGFFVDVIASINPVEGVAEWIIRTIDPATGEQPVDPLIGFLPPNDANGIGDGFVSYSVRAARTVQTGDVIDAVATIVFDTEGPIDTPPIFNTIDAGIPTSSVAPLPGISNQPEILLQWGGTDDEGGSAIGGFTIWVSENGGPFQTFLENTDLTEATFTGTSGNFYAFYSTARDNAGNVEPPPVIPDASIQLGGGDLTPPTSSVDSLPQRQTSASFTVSVTGTDPNPEGTASGVDAYEIYLAIDGGPWTLWNTVPASAPTATYTGQSDQTLAFYSIAIDVAGNRELKSPHIEASTYIPDVAEPVTQVDAVNTADATFEITFSGSDSGGSGLATFDVFVSIDGATPVNLGQFPAGTPDGAGVYSGSTVYQAISDGNSHTYQFYTVGADGEGNQEASPAAPSDITVTASFTPPSALEVTGFDVQRGATQRSFLRYLDLVFSEAAPIADLIASVDDLNSGNDRIELVRFELDGSGAGQAVNLAGLASANGNRMEIDFGAQGIGGNRNSNVGDGYYGLRLDLDNNGLDASDPVLNFYRILGDANGDRTVNSADIGFITSAFGQTGANLDGDVNGDGAVNALDRLWAIRGQGRSLNAGLPLDD
ncbi:MAG: CARDB domain-containing protein [Planctomycetaceae bacterium]